MADFPERYRRVLERLDAVRDDSKGGWYCRCPAHDDNHPSMTVRVGDTGCLLLKCHRNNGQGCTIEQILDAMDCTMTDVFPERQDRPVSANRIEKTWSYRDAETRLVYQTCRMCDRDGRKTYRQRRPNPDLDAEPWIWNLTGVERVLYRLPEILEYKASCLSSGEPAVVFVAEGEKAADSLVSIGVQATCNPCGAGKFHLCDYSPLTGVHAVILPDNDPFDTRTGTWTGQSHAEEVCRLLYEDALSVRYVDLHGLPVKGDAYDWVEYRKECGDPAQKIRGEFWNWCMAKPLWVPPAQPHPLFAAAESYAKRLTPVTRAAWHQSLEDAVADLCDEKNPAKAKESAYRLAAVLLAGGESFLGILRLPRSLPPAGEVDNKNEAVSSNH